MEVKALDTRKGVALLLNGWKYTRPGTQEYANDIVENGISSGVYVDGHPAAGTLLNSNGLFGMLYTGRDYRNKGYAKMCLKSLMKELGSKGFVVASGAECQNTASNQFHESVGMRRLCFCDYIICAQSGF